MLEKGVEWHFKGSFGVYPCLILVAAQAVDYNDILVHILSTWTRRPAEAQLANVPRYGLGVELRQPISCSLYLLICDFTSTSPGREVANGDRSLQLTRICCQQWREQTRRNPRHGVRSIILRGQPQLAPNPSVAKNRRKAWHFSLTICDMRSEAVDVMGSGLA